LNDDIITKKDTLLRLIYLYREMSSEGISLIESGFYIEKLKSELLKEGYIKRANLKTASKSARKAGVSFRTQKYYVTSKGKRRLVDLFPNEFSEESMYLRKYSNRVTERLVKLSDTVVMSEVSGVYIVNRNIALDVSDMDSLTDEMDESINGEDDDADITLESIEDFAGVNSVPEEVDIAKRESILSTKLVCEDCGGCNGQKVWHSTDKYRRVIWQCNSKFDRNDKAI